jgi:hypothetical protein
MALHWTLQVLTRPRTPTPVAGVRACRPAGSPRVGADPGDGGRVPPP